MKILRKKKTKELIERLSFVYYATTTKGDRTAVVTNEIAAQIEMIVMNLCKTKDCRDLIFFVDEMQKNGCTEFIEKYGTYWAKESKKKAKS